MNEYQDNQEIEDLIVDISITLEEADKASRTLTACQDSLNKNLFKIKKYILELEDEKLQEKYSNQVSNMLLASVINQTKIKLTRLIQEQQEQDEF